MTEKCLGLGGIFSWTIGGRPRSQLKNGTKEKTDVLVACFVEFSFFSFSWSRHSIIANRIEEKYLCIDVRKRFKRKKDE